MTTFHVYLLHEHQHGSYICLESYQVEAPGERPAKRLEQTALERVKSHGKLERVKSVAAAKFEIYQVRWLRDIQISQNLISGFAVLESPSGGVVVEEGDPGGSSVSRPGHLWAEALSDHPRKLAF